MTSNCECTISCTDKALISSIVVGVITAILRYTAVITLTPAFLWVLLGIAIGLLGISLLTSGICQCDRYNCCRTEQQFLAGILGTVLFSIVLLGITFAATSFLGAIFSGVLLFFFSYMITVSTCLIKCRRSCS